MDGPGAGVAKAKTGVTEAGTHGVSVVVVDEVVPLEAASFRLIAEVSCVGAESLGRLRGQEEPSMKDLPNVSGREAGLLSNAERSSVQLPGFRSPGHRRGVEHRLVERCRSGLRMKSLGYRCRRTRSG